MLMAQGRLQAVTLRSGEANLLLGLAPIVHPDVLGSGLHLFLGTGSHRGDCLLRGAPPAPIMEGNLEPGRASVAGSTNR